MSDTRKARIAELEMEVARLQSEESKERHAMLQARVDTLFAGLHLSDVPIVKAMVDKAGHHIWVLEGDDDE